MLRSRTRCNQRLPLRVVAHPANRPPCPQKSSGTEAESPSVAAGHLFMHGRLTHVPVRRLPTWAGRLPAPFFCPSRVVRFRITTPIGDQSQVEIRVRDGRLRVEINDQAKVKEAAIAVAQQNCSLGFERLERKIQVRNLLVEKRFQRRFPHDFYLRDPKPALTSPACWNGTAFSWRAFRTAIQCCHNYDHAPAQ